MSGASSERELAGWGEIAGARLRAARQELRSVREESLSVPLIQLLAFVGLYVLALGTALLAEPIPARLGAALVMGFASGKLFLVGHDAAHGSYTKRPLVNAVAGRVALLPSLHAFGLWQHAHKVHHRYTNLKGKDFVWTPLSQQEFERLGRVGRVLHRAYRNEFALGLGLYYLREIWLPRMIVPRRRALGRRRRMHYFDSAAVAGFALCLVAGALWVGSGGGEPSRLGSGALSVLIVGVVPLLYVQWMIGLVIFFNHTHPEIPWFANRGEWSYWAAQVRCTAHQRAGLCPLLPNAVMNHTAHHADPKIPTRRLREGQDRLASLFAGEITSYRWSGRSIRRTLAMCKLYDYSRHRWLDFSGNPTADIRLLRPPAGIDQGSRGRRGECGRIQAS